MIKFTIPTIIMMIFTSIYGVVDGLFILNIVGSDAFASVNLIMPFIMILGTLGFMIGTGGSALVSKTLGEGNEEKANQIFSMLIYFLLIAGLIFSILGFIFIEPIAKLLGADRSTLFNCIIYGRVLLVALIPFLLQNSFQSFLVVEEKPTMGLMISIIAGVINMVLDFLFISVFKMGVFGAAFATGISQFVGGVIPFIYFIRKNPTQLRLVKAKIEKKALFQSCANGLSEMLKNVSTSLVNILYNMQLMKLVGANGVVSYGIIMYISFIFSGTYIGYSIGIAPIVGYHYGSDNKEELKNLFKKSLILIGVVSVTMTFLAELLSRPLASVFVSYDENLLDMTTTAIRLFSLSYFISGFNIFASAFFTALNNSFVSALISFMRTLVFQIIMILILPMVFKLNGVWLAVVVAEFLALLVSAICFKVNRKKYEYI